MVQIRLVAIIIGVLFTVSACSLPRGAAIQSEVVAASQAEEAPFALYPVNRETVENYQSWPKWHGHISWLGTTRGPSSPVIRSGDRIDLVIWDNSENSLLLPPGGKVVDMSGLQIASDGTVFIPYLDKIYLAGKSPEGARKLIQERMGEILPSSQVQLLYTAGSGSSVSLVGGVGNAGIFPLPDRNYSILKLISEGGGVPGSTRNPQVSLVRDGRTFRTSLSRLYDNAKLDVILRGGDKVIVEQDDRYFQALGSSGREELVYFTKDKINALEAMSLVGGINDTRADPKGILILREYRKNHVRSDGKGPTHTDVVFAIDLTSADGLFSAKRFEIFPEDLVLVTESPVTKAQTIFQLIGSVFGLARNVQSL